MDVSKGNGWSLQRRQRQREAIQRWKPWEQSSGPKTAEGKAVAARNAYTGGDWKKMRAWKKAMNELLRTHREQLSRVFE